jgi:hypothetical protein
MSTRAPAHYITLLGVARNMEELARMIAPTRGHRVSLFDLTIPCVRSSVHAPVGCRHELPTTNLARGNG